MYTEIMFGYAVCGQDSRCSRKKANPCKLVPGEKNDT